MRGVSRAETAALKSPHLRSEIAAPVEKGATISQKL
jgi:hypothetical protein